MRTILTESVNDKYTVIWYDQTNSTSAVIEREHENMADMTVIAAESQTAGRGQGDHKWHSRQGENLTFSILVRYSGARDILPAQQQIITPAVSLAVTDFLADFGIETGIKKPNDIYVDGKKICGMLIENKLSAGRMQISVIGIGININQTEFPQDLPNPVSVAMLRPGVYDIKQCLREFLRHFSNRFDAIWTEPEALWKDYEAKVVSIRK